MCRSRQRGGEREEEGAEEEPGGKRRVGAPDCVDGAASTPCSSGNDGDRAGAESGETGLAWGQSGSPRRGRRNRRGGSGEQRPEEARQREARGTRRWTTRSAERPSRGPRRGAAPAAPRRWGPRGDDLRQERRVAGDEDAEVLLGVVVVEGEREIAVEVERKIANAFSLSLFLSAFSLLFSLRFSISPVLPRTRRGQPA